MNTNFFFSQTLRAPPGYPSDIPPKKFDFPGFQGHTELFGPRPFTWKIPTHRKISGPRSLGLGSFFVPDSAPVVYKNPPSMGSGILHATGAGEKVKVSGATFASSCGGVYTILAQTEPQVNF